MSKCAYKTQEEPKDLLLRIQSLRAALKNFVLTKKDTKPFPALSRNLVDEAGNLIKELQHFRELTSPVRFGAIGISLGRSDSIAKFFAFCFTNQEKRPLQTLSDMPFFGSGVYALYYHGNGVKSYKPLSNTETPIYVGKANPLNPQAETVEEQGQSLFNRLKEHSKNIAMTNLSLMDFYYRAAPIQTGMQAAVEDFMIRLFKPIWNKEINLCFGIGKHGDSAETRANKRSPWDTMHPGRKWAAYTKADQMTRADIEANIEAHFMEHPVIPDKDRLFRLLSLENTENPIEQPAKSLKRDIGPMEYSQQLLPPNFLGEQRDQFKTNPSP